ncbi:MAG: hypothetical protein AAB410_03490 [Patescibacteria group bacterium]
MNKLLKFFGLKPKLEYEALLAYFNKLPDDIAVSWVRDGKFIVGKVEAGEHKFTTQGMNPDDFINMVNESVLTAYDIPERYFYTVKDLHTYNPPLKSMAELKNQSIQEAVISANKNKEILEVARS